MRFLIAPSCTAVGSVLNSNAKSCGIINEKGKYVFVNGPYNLQPSLEHSIVRIIDIMSNVSINHPYLSS